mgnify:CR=1 FL=1
MAVVMRRSSHRLCTCERVSNLSHTFALLIYEEGLDLRYFLLLVHKFKFCRDLFKIFLLLLLGVSRISTIHSSWPAICLCVLQ